MKLEVFIRAKAKEKEFERKTTNQKSGKSKLPIINTNKELSKIAGVSHNTIRKLKSVFIRPFNQALSIFENYT